MKLNKIRKYFIMVLAYCCMTACNDMDSTYKEYINNGEIVYATKADSAKVCPGRKRIKLVWKMPADPRVAKAKIYWNDGVDSLEQPIVPGSGLNYIDVMIDNLQEHSYTFQIYTYDNKGNSSIKVEASGSSYGDAFQATCINRPIKSVRFSVSPQDTAVITWNAITSNTMLNTNVEYTDKSGNFQKVTVLPSTTITKLLNYPKNSFISYQTLYTPEQMAIDTFYSVINTKKIP